MAALFGFLSLIWEWVLVNVPWHLNHKRTWFSFGKKRSRTGNKHWNWFGVKRVKQFKNFLFVLQQQSCYQKCILGLYLQSLELELIDLHYYFTKRCIKLSDQYRSSQSRKRVMSSSRPFGDTSDFFLRIYILINVRKSSILCCE